MWELGWEFETMRSSRLGIGLGWNNSCQWTHGSDKISQGDDHWDVPEMNLCLSFNTEKTTKRRLHGGSERLHGGSETEEKQTKWIFVNQNE